LRGGIACTEEEQTSWEDWFSAELGHKPITAGLSDQDPGLPGIDLDFLAQPVDMCFQSVGGDSGIIAPDLMQQRLARHGFALAIEVFQNIGLFFGQPNLFCGGIQQHFGARPERVGTDIVDSLFILLVIAQMRVHPRHENTKAERLGDIIISARFQALNGVFIRVGRSQENDGATDPVIAKGAAQIAAVTVGQPDIQHHEFVKTIAAELACFRNGCGDCDGVGAIMAQLFCKRGAQHLIVVEQEHTLGARHSREYPQKGGGRNPTRFSDSGVCQTPMMRNLPPKTRSKRPDVSPVDAVIASADAFRRGRPVAIRERRSVFVAYAVETLTGSDLDALRRAQKLTPQLVLTHARARTLKIRIYTPHVVALPVAKEANVQSLLAIADPTDDLVYPLKGPFDAVRESLPAPYAAGVKLAKLAGLLPAIVIQRTRPSLKATKITTVDIAGYDEEIIRTLRIVTRARVPLIGAEQSELVGFRPSDGGPEHFAIVINAPPTSRAVLTRLHSECFTGDLLGSLKCDCGDQLRGAIAAIEAAGGGVLLYMAQEGRGIGLINKLRAYRLQDQGFDTIDANERLGFESDERQYGIAARMLELLGYKSVRLLTNNPDKIKGLKAAGVKVVGRLQHSFPDNKHNHDYLRTKATRAGHLL